MIARVICPDLHMICLIENYDDTQWLVDQKINRLFAIKKSIPESQVVNRWGDFWKKEKEKKATMNRYSVSVQSHINCHCYSAQWSSSDTINDTVFYKNTFHQVVYSVTVCECSCFPAFFDLCTPLGDAFPWTISLSQFSVYTLLGQQRSLSLLTPIGCTSTLAVTSHKSPNCSEGRHSFVVCLHVDLQPIQVKCSNPQVSDKSLTYDWRVASL